MKKFLYVLTFLFLQTIHIGADFSKEIHVLTRAVIIQNNHILCAYDPRLRTSTGEPVFYYLPGGHVEYQESAADSVVRELYEETGEHVQVDRFIGLFERSWDGTPQSLKCHKHEVTLVYKAMFKSLSEKDLPVITSRENHKVAFEWLPLEEIGNKDLRPDLLKNNLDVWLAKSSDHVFKSMMHIP